MSYCMGKTIRGKRCKNLVKEGEKYCRFHRNQRKTILGSILAGIAVLVPLLVALGPLANVASDILNKIGKNPHADQQAGNSITAGRDIRDNTIIQNSGDINLNQYPAPSASIVSGAVSPSMAALPSLTPVSVSPNFMLSNQLFLPAVYTSP